MNDQPATLLSHEEVRPQSFSGRRKSTRLQQYRRKLRRRRNRRLAFVVLTTSAIVFSVVVYKVQHPEFRFQQYVLQENLNLERFDLVVENAAKKLESTGRQFQGIWKQGTAAVDNIMNIDKKSRAKKEKEQTTKKKEANIIVEKVIAKIIPTQEEPPKTEEKAAAPSVETKETNDNEENRPVLCNVPLSYLLHPKCWKMASKKPAFNAAGLVHDMMQ